MSLGIQVSISKMREWERFLESTDCESDALFRPRIPLIANPCAQEECIRRAKARRFSQVAELTDLSEMASRKRAFLDHGARVALPDLRQRARFMAHKNKAGRERERLGIRRSVKCTADRLPRGACDSEFPNSLLQRGALHSKICCRPFRARHNPVALL